MKHMLHALAAAAVLLPSVFALAIPGRCASSESKLPGWPTTAPIKKLAQGLKYIDVKVGTGAPAKAGEKVEVNYTGYLTNGTKFDSSVGRQPFDFELGAGQVIKGWDLGVAGMKVGGKRKLLIPAELGYGAAGTPGGPIPPNAALIFDVELLKINP